MPASRLIRLLPNSTPNTTPTPVSGASFTFGPGTAPSSGGTFTTSTPGTYAAVASFNGETSPSGTIWFAAQLRVADHFSEFYLTGSATPLPPWS